METFKIEFVTREGIRYELLCQDWSIEHHQYVQTSAPRLVGTLRALKRYTGNSLQDSMDVIRNLRSKKYKGVALQTTDEWQEFSPLISIELR